MDEGRTGRDNYYREFTHVSPNNTVIQIFISINVHNEFYMQFNKAARKLIKAQGPKGALLFDIMYDVEKYGAETCSDDRIDAFMLQRPRAR